MSGNAPLLESGLGVVRDRQHGLVSPVAVMTRVMLRGVGLIECARRTAPTIFDQTRRACGALGLGVLRQAALELSDHAVTQCLGLDYMTIPAVLEDVHNEFTVIRIGNLELKRSILVDLGTLV